MWNLDQIEYKKISGLKPKQWIVVSGGLSREELKQFFFDQGLGLTQSALVTPSLLAETLLKKSGIKKTLLSSFGRQEGLRILLSHSQILELLPEINSRKRQRSFYKKLDRSIQSLRMSITQPMDIEVFEERLTEKFGKRGLRREVQVLSNAFESWLDEMNLMDVPLLYQKASEFLEENEFDFPEKIHWFHPFELENREKRFAEVLQHQVDIDFHHLEKKKELKIDVNVERWHTNDDAVEQLADQLVLNGWENSVILMADDPSLRRSLNRCLKERGIPLAESRDPTALRWDENLKWAFSPLKVVSSRYETLSVRSYLSYFDLDLLRKSQNWIAEYGIRKDLKNYNCPQLKSLYENLLILEESFGRRMTLEEISSKQLEFLNRYSESIDSHQLELFVFLEKFWKSFQTDLKALGLERKKAPVGWWLERVGDRLDQMGALVDLIKPTHGVQIYRFSQVPFWSNREKIKNLYFLGFSSRWLSGDSVADYGMNDREKDLLSSEFNVTSTFRVIEQRMLILDQWLDLSEQVTFLDSHYAWDGKEKESLHATFQEWPSVNVLETKHYGTHSRWKKSFSGLMKKQENNLKLTPLVKEEVRATELDRYSRCLFQGLAAYRWNLRDVRHAEEELWPDVLGNLLHACVEILLLNRTDQGTFTKSLNEVIEEAQSRVRIKGWMKNRLTDHALIRKIKKILEVFCEKEKEYVLRSGTAVFQLEDQNSLSLQIGKTRVYGRPDRIDSHPDGLFVIDYKTSSQLPAGVEMIEDHYRLQLPFYALAAPLQYQRPVIGAQLIQLNSSGNRNHGIFYKKWNDKKEGLTHTRSKKNVFEEEPEFIWSRAYEAIEHTLKEMESGMYSAVPRKEIECRSCVYSDLCGKRRQRVDLDE